MMQMEPVCREVQHWWVQADPELKAAVTTLLDSCTLVSPDIKSAAAWRNFESSMMGMGMWGWENGRRGGHGQWKPAARAPWSDRREGQTGTAEYGRSARGHANGHSSTCMAKASGPEQERQNHAQPEELEGCGSD